MSLQAREVSGAFEKQAPKIKVFLQMSSHHYNRELSNQIKDKNQIKINKLSGTCDYLTWLPLENEKKKMKKIELANIQIA